MDRAGNGFRKVLSLVTGGVLLAAAASANALDTFLGEVWLGVPPAISMDPSFANAPSTTPSLTPYAQFNTTALNYNASSALSIDNLLGSPTYFNTQNGFSGAMVVGDAYMRFSGWIQLASGANNFAFNTDDGYEFAIPGLGFVRDDSFPQAPNLDNFVVNNPGAAGPFSFVLTYGECCGGPAVLQTNLVPVPEPSTYAMLLAGLGLLGFMARRRTRG